MYLVSVIGLQVPCLSSLNLIQTISTDGSSSISCAGLKPLTRFLNKALSFREAGSLLGPSGNYLLKWVWQQYWSKESNGGNEAKLSKVETGKCFSRSRTPVWAKQNAGAKFLWTCFCLPFLDIDGKRKISLSETTFVTTKRYTPKWRKSKHCFKLQKQEFIVKWASAESRCAVHDAVSAKSSSTTCWILRYPRVMSYKYVDVIYF